MQGNLSLEKRIEAFDLLGRFMAQHKAESADPQLKKLNEYFLEGYRKSIEAARLFNGWFDDRHLEKALNEWSQQLTKSSLTQWVERYPLDHFSGEGEKTVALIMAGNIPLVGFHDLLSVLISGHKALIKLSSDDLKLMPFLLQVLVAIESGFAPRIRVAEGKLHDFDAVIATGSNNSARYFEYYFSKYPHIIRKNRNSVAVLDGSEDQQSLERLGADIFTYYGLGCRNVTHLYLPESFDVQRIFESIMPYQWVTDNKKYANNYDYHRALYMLDQEDFLDNGFAMLKKSERIHAPVSVVHYSHYSKLSSLAQELEAKSEEIQCVVSQVLEHPGRVDFGQSQSPALWDYADRVDTLQFLRAV